MMTTSLQVRNKFPLAVRLGWFTVVLLDVSSGGSLRQFSGLVDLDLVLHSNEELFSTTVVSQTTRLVRWLCRLDQIGLGRDNVVAGTCRWEIGDIGFCSRMEFFWRFMSFFLE